MHSLFNKVISSLVVFCLTASSNRKIRVCATSQPTSYSFFVAKPQQVPTSGITVVQTLSSKSPISCGDLCLQVVEMACNGFVFEKTTSEVATEGSFGNSGTCQLMSFTSLETVSFQQSQNAGLRFYARSSLLSTDASTTTTTTTTTTTETTAPTTTTTTTPPAPTTDTETTQAEDTTTNTVPTSTTDTETTQVEDTTTNTVPGAVTLSLTADNYVLELYFDGELTSIASDEWYVVREVAMPANTTTIAVQCEDDGGVAGFLASTSDGLVLTDSNWKCTSGQPDVNWTLPEYNDADWPTAVIAAPHSPDDVHGVLPGISLNASWIWTINNGYDGLDADTPVYCRLTLTGY